MHEHERRHWHAHAMAHLCSEAKPEVTPHSHLPQEVKHG